MLEWRVRTWRPGLALAVVASALATCANTFTDADVDRFQPPIVSSSAPARPLKGSWSLANNTTRVGLAEMSPLVPAYAGQGHLLASWNPHVEGTGGRPTFIVTHGGHGLTPTNFATALWLQREFAANVMVLDAYWSRGIEENWKTGTRYGASMRALDAIAAARWLRRTQGTDPARTFLMGDSQGGWTVLRTFTDEARWRDEVRSLYRGGIALYQNCKEDGTAYYPRLGPYVASVIVFTGGQDTATPIGQCRRAVLAGARRWIHYPDQTHGWDVANRGAHTPAVDGECGRAMNIYNQFPVCRSDATTSDMRKKIRAFVGEEGVR